MSVGSRLVAMLVLASSTAFAAPELRFAGGTFRPEEARPAATSPRGERYVVAVLRDAMGPEERRRLEEAGAEILGYVPVRGYRIRVTAEEEIAVRRLPFVLWLGEPPSHFKVQPGLAARGSVGAPPGEVTLRAVLEPGEPLDRARRVLARFGAVAAPAGKDGAWRVTASVPSASLPSVVARLSALPEVEAVEEARPLRPLNQDGVWVHQSFVGPSPQQTPIFDRGIYGCGQILGISDTGQDYDLCYFRDTVNGPPPFYSCLTPPCPYGAEATNRRKDIVYYNWSGTPTGDDDTCPPILGSSGHGSHTSGAMAGDTAPYADCSGFASSGRNGGDGQAPGAKIVLQELGDGIEYLNNRGGTLWNLADVAYRNGARVHSNSWGGACHDAFGNCLPGCTLPYDSFARDADLVMWTYPDLLVVTAAGNSGWYCPAPVSVTTPGIAKNVLTVGSVGHGSSASVPSSFSSPGPVFDGRLKPTLAAQGEAVVSAASDANPASNNCATCSLDGSSMSAPTAAGLAALVREYYAAGFLAAGTRNPPAGFAPTAALVKATLVDAAVPLGPSAPGPDFQAGYGRIQLDRTLAFSESSFTLRVDDHREGIATGSVVTHAYDVAAGTPFRATLVWTDYPAALNAATARVNELALEVVDPSGTVWFQTIDPGTGLPTRTSAPSDPHDDRNVEERLVFDAPAAGRWIVRVRGVDVPWGPQPFALVVRGAISDCPAPAAPAAPMLSTPSDHQVLVSWGAVPGATSYNVYRSFGACPAAAWVPVATGVTGTSFLDTTVSGGTTYAYHVRAASDAAAACESARSACASIVPSGDCFLAPEFRGIASAVSSGSASCAVALSWGPARPYCGSDVRYNVYRGTSAGFTPGPSNRIARCLVGTTWTDSVGLAHAASRWYVVRAEDASLGHGGPCRDGNEDGNSAALAAAPFGPPVSGTWTDDAGDTGDPKLATAPPWIVAATGGSVGPMVYLAASAGGVCADLTTPVLTLANPGAGPSLSFRTKHDLDYDPSGEIFGTEGSLGQVEIATGPGFTNWTRVLLSPDYPNPVEFPYNVCPTTQAPARYFTGIRPDYATYTGSLVNWGGGDVKIRFHLSGDLLYSGGNWWVDDIAVQQALVPGPCATASAGPPPVPDGGAVHGLPLRASKSGNDVVLTWDATQCPAAAVNVYVGAIGNFTAFTSGRCGLPATGSATVSMPGNSWFVVAATDGASTDGSWGRTLTGAERVYSGASLACPAITSHVTNNGCP